MIDLHSHLLPCIDDGARSLEMSLEMARQAVDAGTTIMACTPHIYPGLYMNDSAGIAGHIKKLQAELDANGIALKLTRGADAHLVPELLEGLQSGRVPTLHNSRYFLLEPSHHVAPPHFEESVFQIMAAGFVPLVTHPERLTWIEDHYDTFVRLAERGAWMQITAGSITGRFGKRARYWSDRFLDDGLVAVVASDAHNTKARNPRMDEAVTRLVECMGKEEARRMVLGRPQAVLDNLEPGAVPAVPGLVNGKAQAKPKPWYRRLFGA